MKNYYNREFLMTYTSKALPALTALALILGTTALTAPAFASATEHFQEDIQGGGHVPQVMTDIALDDVKAPEQSSGGFFSFGWLGFGSTKAVVVAEVKTEETPVQAVKSGGWFGWGSSKDSGVTPLSTPVSSLPSSTDDTKTDDAAEKLAKLESQLALYAKKQGRNVEDLTKSIFASSSDEVSALTQHFAHTSLNDAIQFEGAGGALRVVEDISGIAMPIHANLFYFVEHKNKRQLHKTWFSGSEIHAKLKVTPDKKFTFLKVTNEAKENAPVLWQMK
jgi:hypothetical protein